MTGIRSAPSPTATVGAAEPAAPAAGPGGRAWWVLGVLSFVYVLNFLDRQLISILAKPIQDDLQITDGQLGLITGLYFALFYTLIAIPVGWLADKTNRVRVLSFACALWSAATIACGLARSYPQLVVARMVVGVGEAGGVPPSYAIISDYFPPGARGRAFGLFNMGPAIGAALGVAFGASIAAAYSWRDAFVAIGIVGIVTAIVVLMFVREPQRGRLDPDSASDNPGPNEQRASFFDTCRMFFARPTLRLIAFAGGATQFVTYAIVNFTVLFLMREKGMTLGEVALYYSVLIGVSTSVGMFVSGRLVDRLSQRFPAAYAYVPAVALIIAIPFFIGFVWAPTWPVAVAFLAVPTCLNFFYLSPAVAFVQENVRPDQRVLSGALLLLVMNLIGLGFGPTYLGAVSDFFSANNPDNSLQLAFYTLVPFYIVAITMFFALARAIKRETAKKGEQA